MWLWTGVPWGVVLSFVAAAASLLMVLHLLRPRPRRLRVATTLFWAEASAAVDGRSLMGRPAQWLSLALLLAALLLSGLALAGPIWSGSETRPVVIVIDNGVPADAAGGLEEAVLASMPTHNSALAMIAAAPTPRLIRGPGEVDGRALRRLRSLPADSVSPAGPSLRLAERVRRMLGMDAQIVVVTPAGDRWRDAASSLALSGVVTVRPYGERRSNAAIISARWQADRPLGQRGTLAVRVGSWLTDPGSLRLTVTDVADGAVLLEEVIAASEGGAVFTRELELPAVGQGLAVRVEMPGDGVEADNTLAFTLPNRPVITASPGPDVPDALRLALLAAGCVVEETDRAVGNGQTRLSTGGDDPAARRARIEVVPVSSSDQESTGLIRALGVGWAEDLDFDDVWLPASLTAADGATPEQAGVMLDAVPLAWVSGTGDSSPGLMLHEAWFSAETSAYASGGFAVMLSRAVSDLLELGPEPVTLSTERAHDDAVWWREQPVARGHNALTAPGSPAVSNLLDRASDSAFATTPEDRGWSLSTRPWLVAITLALAAVGWWLYEKGRIA
ncbi:hypothetical protein [Mucisphaera calidilacus]|uniref:Aerotolerance regulator N-terminal domain-containing protein n=1 Tax=Mucisphaera calidilacus TaxID=2527982 RepID=A0A518BU57_9BACT|nr:hypothetical protein [Mucisphaera calidilacus]QDU70505.1 hypothetical protein Pan265_03330 [Mucisphaera calidilacus]